jgi:hypothetical protein
VAASLYTLVCLGRTSGSEPAVTITIPGWVYRGMCIITIDRREAFHCHHWILLLPAWFLPLSPPGHWFVTGMVLQGLAYRDRCACIMDNPYTSKRDVFFSDAPCSEVVCRV